MLHPTTWVTWTIVVAVASMLTRNPLYLIILLAAVAINYLSASQRRPEARGWSTLLRIAGGLTILIVPFNALNVHAGSHILFRLPSTWPLIGGNITLEAVVWGACSALGLLTLIALFATFNLQVNQAQILRLTPAFIYEAGLIVSIALTFVPQMMISAREIREAQLIRGHRIRRPRDMRPFLMALLTTGLERSFQLAESLEARGFGNVRALPQRRDLLYKGLTLLGLAGLLSSFFALTYFAAFKWPAWAGIVLSALLLLGVFWAQGKRVLRTHYRPARRTWRDGPVLAVSLLVAIALIAVRLQDTSALEYYPYTQLLPPFHPWLGIILLTLIAPAFCQDAQRQRNRVFVKNPVSERQAPGENP
ncbi:MAG: energy-coupling factor transporter transmembrane protein EcfT [Anaerolineales bacterium]|nr:MAG: energy-coupling factor transporter transmembrane protein EcfT [Anaerolineales bacterium]